MEPIPERMVEDPRRPFDNLEKYLDLVNDCDESEPLLSETPLGLYLGRVQLARVAPGRLVQLNQALNVEQLIPTSSGLARDYRGLAELMGFSLVELEARFKRSHNPAKCLIEAYASNGRRQVTLNDLLKFLETLERFDIIDDLLPTLIEVALQEQRQSNNPELATSHAFAQPPLDAQPHRPTEGDKQQQARYDAFVCFAQEDEDHARELIHLLERHDKRVVTTEHLLPGQFEYDALVQMIATGCRKVIILLTPNFLASRDCEFQSKFANEIAIKSGWFPKIIPVLCEPLDDSRLPPLIRVISKIDMTTRRANNRDWQLRKLLGALDFQSNSLAGAALYENGSQQFFVARNHAGPMSRAELRVPETPLGHSPGHAHHSGPIVDLAYSQGTNSATNLSNTQLSINLDDHLRDGAQVDRFSTPSPRSSQSTISPTPSGNQLNPLNWYRSFKKRVLPRSPCESIAPSTSSRTKLLQETTDEKR